jgi:uroporphyrinogen III methyltransferase / synthase
MRRGKIYFVGAGPGDPKLITVRGMELLQKADVIVYDRLANPRLLANACDQADLIYCGKDANHHTLSQEEINQLIIREARAGKKVVRLKGGDPCIFGRVGEEAEECVKAEIPFEIVPGITSGIAAPAYAGIPLTHRDYNASLAFVTGHRSQKNETDELNWAELTNIGTLVIYMGVKNLPYICEQLIKHGKRMETPVALVKWGTTDKQQTLVGNLENIVRKVAEAGFTSPSIIIVGEVVRLREKLNWFESKPLFGKQVLYLSDPLKQVSLESLEESGAEWQEQPVAFLEPSVRNPLITRCLERLDRYDWIVFSKPQQAQFFFENLKKRKIDLRKVQAKLLAVGQETAAILNLHGLYPDYTGFFVEELQPQFLLECIRPRPDAHVLVLDHDNEQLMEESHLEGVCFSRMSMYEQVSLPQAETIRQCKKPFDFIFVTSTQTVKYLVECSRFDQTLRRKNILFHSKEVGESLWLHGFENLFPLLDEDTKDRKIQLDLRRNDGDRLFNEKSLREAFVNINTM